MFDRQRFSLEKLQMVVATRASNPSRSYVAAIVRMRFGPPKKRRLNRALTRVIPKREPFGTDNSQQG
jgi:hypothetical protein